MITTSDYVQYQTLKDSSSIENWIDDGSIFSNREDFKTVIHHLCKYKDQNKYDYSKNNGKKAYSPIYAHYLEIMIPQNFSNEEKKSFIEKYMISLNPCFKNNSFLYCYKYKEQGKGHYIEVICFTRKYYKRKQRKLITYNSDYYFDEVNKRRCTMNNPNAVRLHRKGEPKINSVGEKIYQDYYCSPKETEVFKYKNINNLRTKLIKIVQYVRLLKNRDYWKNQIKFFSRITVSTWKHREKIRIKNQMIQRINSIVGDIQEALYVSRFWYDVERSFYKLIYNIDKILYKSEWRDSISGRTVYLGLNQSSASVEDNLILLEKYIEEKIKNWWNDEIFHGYGLEWFR